jgi:hypothetical protein
MGCIFSADPYDDPAYFKSNPDPLPESTRSHQPRRPTPAARVAPAATYSTHHLSPTAVQPARGAKGQALSTPDAPGRLRTVSAAELVTHGRSSAEPWVAVRGKVYGIGGFLDR